MKINYKNTALDLMEHPDTYDFAFPPNMVTGGEELTTKEVIKFGRSLLEAESKHHFLKLACGGNIQYVAKTFWEAYSLSRQKLKDVFDQVEINEGGVLILQGDPFTHTYYYYVNTYGSGEEWDYDILFMDFSKLSKNEEPHLDAYISRQKANDVNKSLIWKGYLDKGYDRRHFEALIITFLVFKKYCEIETKIIPPNRKDKHVGIKYVNETKNNITILDSTWFTTIVTSEGFGVRGHFRFQPYGPGMKLRKLKWIEAFEKEGYTRTAKVLNQNTDGKQ